MAVILKIIALCKVTPCSLVLYKRTSVASEIFDPTSKRAIKQWSLQ